MLGVEPEGSSRGVGCRKVQSRAEWTRLEVKELAT